ncbi:MAG TPA: BON domain-containing protein [Gemmatimonadaceae bacterium]|nr:BON domain-containing protein [Gemmatimonadaceae bacterium]
MKTDLQLQQDVQDELRWEPSIKDSEIGVAVKDGVVTLSGYVNTYAQKFAAERAAERVSGVRALAEDLAVNLPGAHARTDTEIAHAAVTGLRWDIEVPDDRIKLRVEDGWITLEGTVDWYYEKAAAERAVRYLTGVKGLTNMINVRPTTSAAEVKAKIESALKRSAELDAQKIRVETSDGTVTLRGMVRTWTERQEAERAAWRAPGVKLVKDELVVGV